MHLRTVIKEVGADTEPIGWKSRDDLLLIKQRRNEHDCSFVWTPREANALADSVVKHSLSNMCNLFFEISFDLLPSNIAKQVWCDRLGTIR